MAEDVYHRQNGSADVL